MIDKLILPICLIFFGIIGKAQTSDTLLVYPNPFQDTATIEFHIDQTDTVSLDIYNIFGVNVMPYFQDSIFPVGNYSNLFIGVGLSLGVYFVKLKINDTILTKKVIKNAGASTLNENDSNKDDLFLFPNPTSNVCNIKYTLSHNCETRIQILNSLGQLIKEVSNQLTIGTHTIIVDTKQFADGIYYIRFSDGVITKQAKLIIN